MSNNQNVISLPPPNYMKDLGERLVDNGYNILPLKPKSKMPGAFKGDHWEGYAGWSKHCTRRNGIFEVRMWSTWEGCGIGIAGGNVAAIDIDIDDDPGLAMKISQLASSMLGHSEAIRIGKAPKRLIVYASPHPFKKIRKGPIEVLCDGQQFVAYAIHPDTSLPYTWPLEGIADIHISELPEIDEEKARAFVEAAYKLLPDRLKKQSLNDSNGNDHQSSGDLRGTLEGITSAMAYIPNDDLHYDDWVKLGMAIKGALGDEGYGVWKEWSERSSKNVEAATDKAWASFKPKRIGAGAIYHIARDRYGWVPPSNVTLNARRAEAAAACPNPAMTLADQPPYEEPDFDDDDEPAFDEDDMRYLNVVIPESIKESLRRLIRKHEKPEPPYQPSACPDFVKNAPGLIGDIARWMTETAIYPQPELAMAAALTTIGTAAGRRWTGPMDIRTNVYCIGIAGSGSGKEHQLSCISSILSEAGLDDYLAGEEIASGAAVDSTIADKANQLFLIDEVGHFFGAVLNQRAASTHKREIMTKMTKYTGAASRTVKGTEYANKRERKRVDVHQPCISIYGTTVPKPLWEAFGEGNIEDGSMARWLFFTSSDDYPRRNKLRGRMPAVPDRVIQGIRRIVAREHAESEMGLMSSRGQALDSSVKPNLWTVDIGFTAGAMFEDLSDEQDDIKRKNRKSRYSAIWARWQEHITRLAMIAAIARDQINPEISQDDLRWAREVVDHCATKTIESVEEYEISSEYHRVMKKAEKIIKEAGKKGIRRRDFNRKMGVDPLLRARVIQDLVEMEIIEIASAEPSLKGGKPGEIYRAT